MTRYVIDPGVALRLAAESAIVADAHQLVAPTLLRSQVLSLLYQAVARGDLDREIAGQQLDYLRALRIRLLGDRVLQGRAWRVAEQLGWPDTLTAEYLALTQLQADAFVTLDPALAETARSVVAVAPFAELI